MNIRALQLSFIALFYLFQVSAVIAQSTTTIQRTVPEDQLIVLLLKERYKELDKNLQKLQKTYITDRTTENNIHKAFYEFYRNDQSVGKKLNEWVTHQPNSAISYLARGIYRTKMGWESRGANWASDTSNSQFSGMAAWFSAAKEDFNQAVSIDPSLVEAYCYLIEIDMNEGGQKIQALFNQALKINPSSFIAREFYIHSQLPRWGGSYEDMKKTIADTSPYYKNFPQLRVIEGRIDADLGELAAASKDYKGAIQFFDNALVNGDFWFYNQKKGEALWEVDDYKGAVEQFSRVIRDKPGYKRAWWMRAQAYKMLSQFPEALAEMNYTINIEPNDDLAIAARGYILQISGNLVSALEDFRNAAKLNPTNTMHQDAIREIQQLMSSAKS